MTVPFRAILAVALSGSTLAACMPREPVRSAALEPAPTVRMIRPDVGGTYLLPDGTRVLRDEQGGFTLPNGAYVRRTATGDLLLPNGSYCKAAGPNYICP